MLRKDRLLIQPLNVEYKVIKIEEVPDEMIEESNSIFENIYEYFLDGKKRNRKTILVRKKIKQLKKLC